MQSNIKTICYANLLKDLPLRPKEVLARRFGLDGEKETLESIGQDLGITRERVRQIETDGLTQAEKKLNSAACQNVFQSFASYLKSQFNNKLCAPGRNRTFTTGFEAQYSIH